VVLRRKPRVPHAETLTPTVAFVIDDEVSERLPHLGGVGPIGIDEPPQHGQFVVA
jgi:hypothetical protein